MVPGDSLTQIPVNGSSGKAYGVELLLSKKNIFNENRLSGWVSYAFAFARRSEDNIEIPFRFDQRNTFNFVMNYKVNDWFDIGIKWQYGSGFPFTEPVGIEPRIVLMDKNLDGIPETPEIAARRNSSGLQEVVYDIDYSGPELNQRRPPYHRLDIRLTALADFWDLDWSFYLDVINVYNRSNIINYNYHVTSDLKLGREANTQFPILPTLGFSLRF
jgi:hypothetical protein